MSFISKVLDRPELFAISRGTIGENGIEVGICDSLVVNGDLDSQKVCILKLDEHERYNSRYTANPPPMIDNLAIVQCCDGSVRLYFLELRSANGVGKMRQLKPAAVREKFVTAANDFAETNYGDLFNAASPINATAHLVCNPWRQAPGKGAAERFKAKVQSSALDTYASMKPIEFLGRPLMVNPILPPDPVIHGC